MKCKMTQFSDISDVKASIRAVLSSSQAQLTVNDLSRDYKTFDGSEIPFRKYGYRSLLEFLRSIPDVVTLQSPNYYNSIVTPVSDGKTAHIDKFVTFQKPKPSVRRPKRSFPSARIVDTIPYDLKKSIWHLISQHQEGMPMEVFHEKVNHMLYQSFVNRPVEDVINEISNFTYTMDGRIFLNENAKRNEKAVYMKKKDVEETKSVDLVFFMPSDSELDDESAYDFDYSNNRDKSMSVCSKGKHNINSRFISDAVSEVNADENCDFPNDNPIINKLLIKNLRLLLEDEENINGIWACDLAKKYLMKFGYELCPKNNGFDDVIDMAARLPEVFKYRRFRFEGDYLLEDARKKVPVEEKKEEGEIPVAVIIDLKKLLSKRSKHSLYTDDLPREYKRCYQKTLKPEEFGFENMDCFLKHLEECSSEFTFRRVKQKVLINLNDDPDPVNDLNDRDHDKDDAILNFPHFNPFPSEVCQMDFKLDPEPFLDNIVKGQKFLVKIAEVYTPGKFYLHLASNVKKLERMMDDLNSFYEENGHEYEVSATAVNRGLLCACQYSADNRWHRISVINTKLTQVKAKFIDYGTMEEINMDKLRYLHRDFAKLPALSIRSKLSGIQPKKNGNSSLGNRYEDKVCLIFYDFASSGDLEAEVVEYNAKAACLEVFLSVVKETGEKQPIHEELIKYNLVEKKSARSTLQSIQLDLKISDAELKSIPSAKSNGKNEEPTRGGKVKVPTMKDEPFLDILTESANIKFESSQPPPLPAPREMTTNIKGPPPGLSLPTVNHLDNHPLFNPQVNLGSPYYNTSLIVPSSVPSNSFGPTFSVPSRFNPLSMHRVMTPPPLTSFMDSYPRCPTYMPFDCYPVPKEMYVPGPTSFNVRPPPGLFHSTYNQAAGFPSAVTAYTHPSTVVTQPVYQCQNMYRNDPSLNNNDNCLCKMCLRTTVNGTGNEVKYEKMNEDKLASALGKFVFQVAAERNISKDSFKDKEKAVVCESIRERMGVENELKKIFKIESESSAHERLETSSNSTPVKRTKKPFFSELANVRNSSVLTKSFDDLIKINGSTPTDRLDDSTTKKCSHHFSNKTKLEHEESCELNVRENGLPEFLGLDKEKINPIKQFVLQCKKQAAA